MDSKLKLLEANPQFQQLGSHFQDLLRSIAAEVTEADVTNFLSVAVQARAWEMMQDGSHDARAILALARKQNNRSQQQLHHQKDPEQQATTAGSATTTIHKLRFTIDLLGDEDPQEITQQQQQQEANEDGDDEETEVIVTPEEQQQRLIREETCARSSVEGSMHKEFNQHRHTETNSEARIKHDAGQFLFWRSGHRRKLLLKNKNKNSDHSEDDDANDDNNEATTTRNEMRLQGADAYARLARLYERGEKPLSEYVTVGTLNNNNSGGGDDDNDEIMCECHNGFTAAIASIQCLLEPEELGGLVKEHHQEQNNEEEEQGQEQEDVVEGSSHFAKGAAKRHNAKTSKQQQHEPKQLADLARMLCLLFRWWDDETVIECSHRPVRLCWPTRDGGGGESATIAVREVLVILLLRFLFPTTSSNNTAECTGGCRTVNLKEEHLEEVVQTMILFLIASWKELKKKNGGKNNNNSSVSNKKISWLYSTLINNFHHDDYSTLWLDFFVAMRQEQVWRGGPQHDLATLGTWLFHSRDSFLQSGADDDDHAKQSAVAFQSFVFELARLLSTDTQHCRLWFLQTSNSSSDFVHLRQVVEFICSNYATATTTTSSSSLPADIVLIIANTMHNLGMETVQIGSGEQRQRWTANDVLTRLHDFKKDSSNDREELYNNYLLTTIRCYSTTSSSCSLPSNLFTSFDDDVLQQHWFTRDTAEAHRRHQQRLEIDREATRIMSSTGGVITTEEHSASTPFFAQYKQWLIELNAKYKALKTELLSQAMDTARATAREFSGSFESEMITTYRKVTGEHNARMQSRFARLRAELCDEEEEHRRNNVKFFLHFPSTEINNSNNACAEFLSTVLVPYCTGAQQILVEEANDWRGAGVLETYRAVAHHWNTVVVPPRFKLKWQHLFEHEERERKRISSNDRIPRLNIARMYQEDARNIAVQLIKFTEVVRDADGLCFLVNPTTTKKNENNNNNTSFELYHTHARIKSRTFPRMLLEKGAWKVECVSSSSDNSKSKKIVYSCVKDPTQTRYDSIREVLGIPRDIWLDTQVSQGKSTMIDTLFRLGVWVSVQQEQQEQGDAASAVPYAYHSATGASTWNPRRNWCLPREMWDESGTASMVFQPTSAFDASVFPNASGAAATMTGTSAAAVDTAASGVFSRAATGTSGLLLLLDSHGNTYEETAAADSSSIIMPTADSEVSWIVRWLLENKPDQWRAVKANNTSDGKSNNSSNNKATLVFEFVPTGRRYDGICDTLGIPDLVLFVEETDETRSAGGAALVALERDGVWVRAQTDAAEDPVPYAYHSSSGRSVWELETEWFVPE